MRINVVGKLMGGVHDNWRVYFCNSMPTNMMIKLIQS